MLVFEWILILLLAAVGLAAIARRIGAPYPSLLALGGATLAFVPGAPALTLEPDLALALFVAPVLLDAAYDASLRDVRANWLPIASLVVMAVGLTTAAVAYIAHALVPGLPWAAAIALGAIVAPPDAAAATAVLRQVRPPYRVLLILEAESLFNDATALLIYRVAVAAAAAGAFSFQAVAPTFAVVVVGSVIFGFVLGWGLSRLIRRVTDAPTSIVLQFVSTFGIWILADQIGLSGILTIVSYAMFIARRSPSRMPARLRVPSYAVWDTVIFVLNVLAFVLIGLQLRPILERLDPTLRWEYLQVAVAVLATVALVRIAWVMSYNTAVRLKYRWLGTRASDSMPAPTVRGSLIVSWCGMRGIVTLAAALALPTAGAEFPHRDLILFAAFSVVLGTLVLQGLTLRPLLQFLDVHDDGWVEREVTLARRGAIQAALDSLGDDPSPAAERLRQEFQAVIEHLDRPADDRPPGLLPHDDLRRQAVEAARAAISGMRVAGEIGDEAYHRVEAELDLAELFARRRE